VEERGKDGEGEEKGPPFLSTLATPVLQFKVIWNLHSIMKCSRIICEWQMPIFFCGDGTTNFPRLGWRQEF